MIGRKPGGDLNSGLVRTGGGLCLLPVQVPEHFPHLLSYSSVCRDQSMGGGDWTIAETRCWPEGILAGLSKVGQNRGRKAARNGTAAPSLLHQPDGEGQKSLK